MDSTAFPKLVIVRGIPGSGKTFLAEKVAKILEGEVVMLDPDAIDTNSDDYQKLVQELSADGVDEKLYPYRYLRAKAFEGIDNDKVVMWNQPFTSHDGLQKTITKLKDYAAEKGKQMPVLVVEVEADVAEASKRVVERKQAGGHGPSEQTFAKFVSDYQSFIGNGYMVTLVNGAEDADWNAINVVRYIGEMTSK